MRMNIQMLTGFIALIREILRQPGIKKYNTKKKRLRNILMINFLLMFLGFAVMTEQAIIQSNAKYKTQSEILSRDKLIEEMERDLYLKKLSESLSNDTPP